MPRTISSLKTRGTTLLLPFRQLRTGHVCEDFYAAPAFPIESSEEDIIDKELSEMRIRQRIECGAGLETLQNSAMICQQWLFWNFNSRALSFLAFQSTALMTDSRRPLEAHFLENPLLKQRTPSCPV